jgi:hypothetical protein
VGRPQTRQDQFRQPLEGIEVRVSELGISARTNADGNYGFGFGQPAAAMIPAGRYRAVANPGMGNSAFGSTEFWLTVSKGRLNANGFVKVPYLNPQEPFRLAASRQAEALLASKELKLNLSQATLSYPNGRTQGMVHAQFMKIQEVSYRALPAAHPSWVFSIQPSGIQVDGTVDVTLAIPKLFDSYEYVEMLTDRVILVALDPESLEIVPVGVGLVNKEQKTVSSEKPLAVKRLDIIGYALTAMENETILQSYAQDEITLEQMIGQLQVQQ